MNNLKDVTVEIPRGKFVVITGISGSGKSSLAFDTLFAEGQRRFAESLSSYARQFLGRMSKPDVELIEGIPPAIAIEQKVNTRNPRSTIATSTEIYDYLRMIYARIGRTYSPVTGEEVKCHTANDVLEYIFEGQADAAYLLAELRWSGREDKVELMLQLKEEGYSRFLTPDGRVVRIEEVMQKAVQGDYPEDLYLLVDRVRQPKAGDEDLLTRLHASVDTAFVKGDGTMYVRKEIPGQAGNDDQGGNDGVTVETKQFISRFEADGMTFEKPDEYLFSFNSPLGACPVCGGLGKIVGISEDLVVPDKSRTIYDGAIACWRGDKMGWFKDLVVRNSARYGIPIFEPYCNLSQEVKDKLWKGIPAENEEDSIIGLNEFFKWVEANRYKIQYKYMLSRYSGKTVCQECGGSRLRKEALYVKVGGKNIHELLCMNVDELLDFLENISLDETDSRIAGKAIDEIKSRLKYIQDVGLGYLTLDRTSNTLSGGESQRINLVTALGSSLVGSLYILDEPSIGLHPRDTERLISVLKRLRDIGNTVVVVEHDEEIMREADLIIDIGPKAGVNGGEIVYKGILGDFATPEEMDRSLTLQYLEGDRKRYARKKRTWDYSIKVEGAMEHNLKDINVSFPLGILTVVTGVSGSGKSSLVGDILYPAMYRHINQAGAAPGTFRGLSGNLDRITQVEYVDQNPIGKSSRSNAVTYLKIYDDIRKLLSDQQYAKLNGYTPSHFSFNMDGGRCPECQGEGFVKIGMQFMADVTMVRSAPEPLYAGLQAAILGNYIDFSALQGEVSFEKLDEMLDLLHTIEVDRSQFEALRADLSGARELLYLTDNAGEIGFDRVFLEVIADAFPRLSITVCVRGGPTQNDATREDAQVVGMPFRIIDNGTRIPGTVLELASDELKAALEKADVTIAKGQANVETLLDTGHGYNIYYAFLVKCKRFIDRFGREKLTPMLVRDREN